MNWRRLSGFTQSAARKFVCKLGGTAAKILKNRIVVFLFSGSREPSDNSQRQGLGALMCLAICGLLVFRMYDVGIQRGIDGTMYEAIDDATNAVAVALSDLIYGLNQGYVGYRAVEETLERNGMTKRPALIQQINREYPKNLQDRALMNGAIAAAMHVPVPRDVSFESQKLISMVYADLGIVDYYKAAFRLFGFRVESAYYFYFILLAVSVIAFILAHCRSSVALAVLVLVLAAGNIVVSASVFNEINLATVANPRFLSTLGILPGLHLLVLMIEKRRLTWDQAALAAVQASMICFVISIRSALFWMFLLVVAVAVLQLGIIIARNAQSAWSAIMPRRIAKNWLVRKSWPAVLLVLGFWAFQTTISIKMHPSYELDDFIPYHPRYHNAFVGLSIHPGWDVKFGKDYNNEHADTLGHVAGIAYFKKYFGGTEAYYSSPLSMTLKWRLHDRMMRDVYLQFIRQHPWFVIEAHFVKLGTLIGLVTNYVGASLVAKAWWAAWTASGAVVFAAILTVVGRARQAATSPLWQSVARICALGALTMLFSWLPPLYAIPIQFSMGDQFWTGSLFLLILCWAAMVVLMDWAWASWAKAESQQIPAPNFSARSPDARKP